MPPNGAETELCVAGHTRCADTTMLSTRYAHATCYSWPHADARPDGHPRACVSALATGRSCCAPASRRLGLARCGWFDGTVRYGWAAAPMHARALSWSCRALGPVGRGSSWRLWQLIPGVGSPVRLTVPVMLAVHPRAGRPLPLSGALVTQRAVFSSAGCSYSQRVGSLHQRVGSFSAGWFSSSAALWILIGRSTRGTSLMISRIDTRIAPHRSALTAHALASASARIDRHAHRAPLHSRSHASMRIVLLRSASLYTTARPRVVSPPPPPHRCIATLIVGLPAGRSTGIAPSGGHRAFRQTSRVRADSAQPPVVDSGSCKGSGRWMGNNTTLQSHWVNTRPHRPSPTQKKDHDQTRLPQHCKW